MKEENRMPDDVELLKRVYVLFHRRDIRGRPCDHASGRRLGKWNGRWSRARRIRCAAVGNVNGRSSIRMSSQSRSRPNGKGEVTVKVHEVVRDLTGNLLADRLVIHVFQVRNGLIQRVDIRDVS